MKIPQGALQDAGKIFGKEAGKEAGKSAGKEAAGDIASGIQMPDMSAAVDGGDSGSGSPNDQLMSSLTDMIKNLPVGGSQLGSAIQKMQDKGSAPAGQGAAQQPPAGATGGPAAASSNSDQDVIDGDATHGAKSTDHAPAGMSADDIGKLDGGLEGKTGDQTLKGAGADGIKGDKDIQSIVGNQVQGGLSGSDADKAWQKLEVEQEAKNAPQANGKQASADTRHNGNLSGLQPSDEVASDSDIAFLQNEAKGQKTKGGASDKMDASDGETSGAQQVGQKILDGLGEAAKWLGKIAAKIFPEFAPEIKLAAAGIDVGMHAAGAAADKQDVGEAAKKTAEDELNPMSLLT